ncbi:MAG: cytochrome c/FTR1 family iron permease [Gemmatimonadetes bacterium]|nr:cytochrome c/FTR1 family iron permease [Gemmatimonadota bacterium]
MFRLRPVVWCWWGFILLVAPIPGSRQLAAQDDAAEAARRVIAMSSLAAKEYANGVSNGVVVSPDEVDEAVAFLGEARRATTRLPDGIAAATKALIDSALAMVRGVGPAQQVERLALEVASGLLAAVPGTDDDIPSLRPSLSWGSRLFAQNCTDCHGASGAGDGFRAPNLDPPPADLTDAVLLADQSPLDHFRKIRFGVAGTDMEAFEDHLADEEIWAVVWYVTRFRATEASRARGEDVFTHLCPACTDGDSTTSALLAAPSELADPARVARSTDEDLYGGVSRLAAVAGVAIDSAEASAAVDYLRTLPFAHEDASGPARTFALVRTELARALRGAREEQWEAAAATVFDAYAVFEEVETEVRLRDPALAATLEATFGTLRGQIGRGDDPAALLSTHDLLTAGLETAQALLDRPSSTLGLFVQSFILLLREGLEAILIVGALTTLIVRAGAPERRRDVWWGVGAAVAASVVTAVLLESVFRFGVAEQEALEGVVMLLAAGVLVWVSYWLLAKVDVQRWKAFVTSKAHKAVTSGSVLTLAGAAFLAVYREGFETILFYKALIITADGQGAGSILLGAVAATACLVGIYAGIAYAGLRIPMRPFFGATSAILFYMAFTFAGKGIAELQQSRLVNTTLLDWAPHVPWMGIYPTLQTIVIQAALLGLLAFGVMWTFLMQPQRVAAR